MSVPIPTWSLPTSRRTYPGAQPVEGAGMRVQVHREMPGDGIAALAERLGLPAARSVPGRAGARGGDHAKAAGNEGAAAGRIARRTACLVSRDGRKRVAGVVRPGVAHA
jgi:hypothetical protein